VVIKTLPFSCKREMLDNERDVYPTKLRLEMSHELKVYERLEKLQGIVIPKLLWYGEIVEGMADALATEYIGPTLSPDNLTPVLARAAVRALDTLHENGVLHGDVALKNFCARGSEVMIIDFGFAEYRQDISKTQWSSKVAKEKEELSKELSHFLIEPQKVVQSAIAGQKRAFEEVL